MFDKVMECGDAMKLAEDFIKEKPCHFFSMRGLKEYYLLTHTHYYKSTDGKTERIQDTRFAHIIRRLIQEGKIRRYSRSNQHTIYKIRR